jgi:hypothetical protein
VCVCVCVYVCWKNTLNYSPGFLCSFAPFLLRRNDRRAIDHTMKSSEAAKVGAGVAMGCRGCKGYTNEQHMGLFVDTSQPEPSKKRLGYTLCIGQSYCRSIAHIYVLYLSLENTLKKGATNEQSTRGIADVSKPTS